MADGGFTGAAGGGDTSNLAPGKHRGPRFSWNPQFEATFFQSLCESVQMGLREGSTFKPEAWDRAMSALIQKHAAYANKSHLINKSDNARKKFRLWRGLREDPEFQYNRATRTVTATDDAWKRHIEREPLSRSLKGRPFEHEDFYEILFPDVVGTAGAAKRLTKPRRKGPDNLNGSEEQDAPGTTIMDLLGDASFPSSTQGHIPSLQPTPTPAPAPLATNLSSMHHQQHQQQHPQQQHTRPTSTILPPRNSVASASALTPPEDPATHTRKRFQRVDTNGTAHPPSQPEKRRRTTATTTTTVATPASAYLDLTQQQQSQPPQPPQPQPQPQAPMGTIPTASGANPTNLPPPGQSVRGSSDGTIQLLSEAIRLDAGKLRASWQEQAMDIFFRDFYDEDPDLQLKIAEKALTDENKAMVFVKMPVTLRKHWVKRLREVHNRIA